MSTEYPEWVRVRAREMYEQHMRSQGREGDWHGLSGIYRGEWLKRAVEESRRRPKSQPAKE